MNLVLRCALFRGFEKLPRENRQERELSLFWFGAKRDPSPPRWIFELKLAHDTHRLYIGSPLGLWSSPILSVLSYFSGLILSTCLEKAEQPFCVFISPLILEVFGAGSRSYNFPASPVFLWGAFLDPQKWTEKYVRLSQLTVVVPWSRSCWLCLHSSERPSFGLVCTEYSHQKVSSFLARTKKNEKRKRLSLLRMYAYHGSPASTTRQTAVDE